MKKIISLVGALVLFFSQYCYSNNLGIGESVDDDLIISVNKNIQSFQKIVKLHKRGTSIVSVDSSDANSYKLFFSERDYPIIIYRIKERISVDYPCVSIYPDGEDYYWILSDKFLLDRYGKRVKVTDESMTPSFQCLNNNWSCKLGKNAVFLDSRQVDRKDVTLETVNNELVILTFPSCYQFTIPMSSMKLPDVSRQDFYKDIFLDAGIGLTSRKFLYAARYLNLSTEGVSCPRSEPEAQDYTIQNEIISGTEEDMNGRLLYPDGSPRYKLLFVCGGSSTTHGKSLNSQALQNMRFFVRNGGSYVGTCAGAFFATSGYDDHDDYPYYLSLWPSKMIHTGISGSYTGMFIEQHSPLLNYADFGGDYYVSDIRHNKGGYPFSLPTGTEVLARYDCPEKTEVHNQPSAWAYKPSPLSGRIIMEGSHPEEVSEGERMEFTASMLQYAIDGIGQTQLKGFLQNGEVRLMDKDAEDNLPLFAKIGDLQCHHFALNIPHNANNISITVDTSVDCDLSLMLKKGTYAYPDIADYISSDDGAYQKLSFHFLPAGLWYVSVKCLNTVDVLETDFGQMYTDNSNVLNGVPYRITASWDILDSPYPITGIFDLNKQNVHHDRIYDTSFWGTDGRRYIQPSPHRVYIHEGKQIMVK